MEVADWLRAACADADRRGLAELKPLLEALARATTKLRRADTETGGMQPHEPQPDPGQ